MSAFLLTASEGDEAARRLAEALSGVGVPVQVVAASAWEAAIAADHGRCLILWWTDFDDVSATATMTAAARLAAGRGSLVPVRAGKRPLPDEFASGGLDLSRWRGSPRNDDFTGLAAAVRARTAAASVSGRASRSKWGYVGGALSVAGGLLAVIANFGGIQQPICTVGAAQPTVSDLCGALGWANRPTRAERLAWREVDQRSCAALRDFTRRFPEGVYHASAADLLTARQSHWRSDWSPVEQPLALFVGRDAPAARTRADAQGRALAAGREKGERRCRDFAASGIHRYRDVRIEPQEWLCSNLGSGHVCGFDGRAVCRLEARSETLVEQCGPKPR